MGIIKKKFIEDSGEVVLDAKPLTVAKENHIAALAVLPAPSHQAGAQTTKADADLFSKDQLSPRATQLIAAVASLDDVKDEAKKIVTDADQRARKILEEARRKADNLTKQAETKGHTQGLAEGKKEVAARLEEALSTLNQAVKQRKKIIKDAEAEVLRLSIKVAEQIVRSEVSLHRDVCLNIISEAIGRVSDREQLILKVNREDIEQVKKYKDRIAGLVDGVKSFTVLEDSNVEPGGCIIETNLGYVDARISTKLAIMEDALFRVIDSGKQ